MQKININVLKPHPNNNDYFDDLSGEEFERLKNSIRDEKIYTDILVSPDMTIISGHQRVRAAKELGFSLVPIKIDEDLQDEDSKLRALISNNFGRRKNSPEKDRKALATYVALRGYEHGGSRCQNGTLKLSLDEIAKELNTSKRNLQRALSIERNLTDSMKEILDKGVITKTLASDIIASLSDEEQQELIKSFDKDKKYTQKQVEEYIAQLKSKDDKVKQLESDKTTLLNKLNDEKNKQPRVVERVVEKIPEDYERLKKSVKDYEKDYKDMRSQFESKVKELQEERQKVKALTDNTAEDEFNKKIKDSTFLFCTKVANFIEQVGGYVWLGEHIDKLPEFERAGYIKAIETVSAWADTLKYNIDVNSGNKLN